MTGPAIRSAEPSSRSALPPVHRWQPPGQAVEQLAEARATGALRTEGGTLYLAAGEVVQVESERATGLASILTACGRMSPEAWRETVRVFGPEHAVGRALVEQGHLTQGELELCHLGALYDAAFFALSARSVADPFEPGVQHWLGPVGRVGARALHRETVRRQDLLERIWPWPQIDTAPVLPSRQPPGGRALGPRRRALLDLADGRRTPADIARLLGRSAFATTAEIRRLAAAGLVETPQVDTSQGPVGLVRRIPGASLAAAHRASAPDSPPVPRQSPRPLAPDPDVALLTRVLTALEARL